MRADITRLAVVGTSGYAGYLLERLWELPDRCRVIAATSRDAVNHPSIIKCLKHGVEVYPDVEAMLSVVTPDLCDAIVIATGIDSHHRYVTQALRGGFHVLLEKPPVPTIQELDELLELQRKTGRAVALHFQHLYDERNQKLKQLISSGHLGAVQRVRALAGWPRPANYFRRSPWTGKLRTPESWVLDGTVANPLAHLVAQELFFATPAPGLAMPATVQAELYRANKIEGEDTSSLRIVTTEGVEILFLASLAVQNQRDVLLEIETDRAVVTQTAFGKTTIRHRDGHQDSLASPDFDDERLTRRQMLTTIFDALQAGTPQPFDLAACRPYVLTLNSAFESNGLPRTISDEFRQVLNSDEPPRVVVSGMEDALEKAFHQRALFSEAGIPWATPSAIFDCAAYKHFPAHRALREVQQGRPQPQPVET